MRWHTRMLESIALAIWRRVTRRRNRGTVPIYLQYEMTVGTWQLPDDPDEATIREGYWHI